MIDPLLSSTYSYPHSKTTHFILFIILRELNEVVKKFLQKERKRIKETDCLTPGFSFIFDQFVPHLHHLLNEPLSPASLLCSFLSCRNSSIDTTNEQIPKLYRTFAWTIKVNPISFRNCSELRIHSCLLN